MPTPKKGESKQEYLKRCTTQLVESEGRDPDQAYAICNSMWIEAKNRRQAMALSAPVEFSAAEAEKGREQTERTFHITAYTGRPLEFSWGKLAIDVSGIRAKPKMPVLREHQRDRIVGRTKTVIKDGSNLLMSGTFSQSTRDAAEVLALADEGYPWEASIGVWPIKVQVLDSEKEVAKVNGYELRGPAEIWRESDVREVSFVTLGRDPDSAAISLALGEDVQVEIYREQETMQKEKIVMTREEFEEKHPELYREVFSAGAASVDRTAVQAEAAAAERTRILALADAQLGEESGRALRALVESGITVEQFLAVRDALSARPFQSQGDANLRAQMLELLKATGAPNPGAGAKPVPASASTWEAELERLQKTERLTLAQAVRKLARERPELHEAYLASLKSVNIQ